MLIFSVTIAGLIIGSFLNVCIYRLPKGKSIITPRSYCPCCNHAIPWYDNIPVLSFVLLGGRCRFCKKRISLRYIIVELLTAGAFVLLVNTLGLKITTLIYMLLCSGMIVATFVDFEYQEIPDEISYGGMIMGLILSPIFPQLHSLTSRSKAFYISLAGLITGGLIIYGIGAIGKLIFKKDAMGGGDVKFLAMIGTFLGPRNAVLIFFVAPFFGSIVGVFMKLRYKAEVIPYGPYLSLASATVILWGDRILKTVFPYL